MDPRVTGMHQAQMEEARKMLEVGQTPQDDEKQ